jgi:hypothetical protein
MDTSGDPVTQSTTQLNRIETAVRAHAELLEELREKAKATEGDFRQLLSVVENFCTQAEQRVQRIEQNAASRQQMAASASSSRQWLFALAGLVIGCAIGMAIMWKSSAPAPPAASSGAGSPSGTAKETKNVHESSGSLVPDTSSKTVSPERPSKEPAGAISKQAPGSSTTPSNPPSAVMQLDVAASEPTWVSLWDASGKQVVAQLFNPGDTRSFKLSSYALLRAGNAGGLSITLDGKALGPLGPHGSVRELELRAGAYQIRTAILPGAKKNP